MKFTQIIKLSYSFFRRNITRFTITISFVVILLTFIIVINAVADTHIRFIKELEKNKFSNGIDININNNDSNLSNDFKKISNLLNEKDYDFTVNDFSGYAKYLTPLINYNINISVISYDEVNFDVINDLKIKNGIFLSENLYELVVSYLGIELGENINCNLVFSEQVGYDKDMYAIIKDVNLNINGCITGIIKNSNYNEYVISLPRSFVMSQSEISQNYNFKIKNSTDDFNKQKKDFKKLYNMVKKEVPSAKSVIMEEIIYSNKYCLGVRLFVILLSLLQFLLCINGLRNSITISFAQNDKTFALLSIYGMKKKSIAKLAIIECVTILGVGIIISYVSALALKNIALNFKELIFGYRENYYIAWYIPIVLFGLLSLFSIFSIVIKTKKLIDRDSFKVLRGEK